MKICFEKLKIIVQSLEIVGNILNINYTQFYIFPKINFQPI